MSGSFVDDELRDRETDLLFTCQTADERPCLFYVLLEHQSTPDKKMP